MDSPAVLPALDNTFGAILLGVLVSTALWGFMAVQSYDYYIDYPNDHVLMKGLVAVTFVLDTTHHAFMCHCVYIYLIKSWSNPVLLGTVVWSLEAQVFLAGLIGFMVQFFFIWRIWIMSYKNYYICVVIACMATGLLGLTTYYWAKGLDVKTFLELPTLEGISKAVNALATATDLAISSSLSFFLYRERTGIKRTNIILKQLMVYSVISGTWNSVCSLSSLVSLTLWPDTLIFIAFYNILIRLYSNSLLSSLNARIRIREKADKMSGGTPSLNRSGQSELSSGGALAFRPVQVHMRYETQVETPTQQKSGGYELNDFRGDV